MTNPFDDEDALYVVLVNCEGQHSLWPAAKAVPAGWETVHQPASRRACLDYVNENWTDLRPKSLVDAISQYSNHNHEGRTSDRNAQPRSGRPAELPDAAQPAARPAAAVRRTARDAAGDQGTAA